MNLNSETASGLALFLEQKRKYRIHARNVPLGDRLRQLEVLQEQSYEIMSIREANGGMPVPEGWKKRARAQEALKK
jgi:hypothetical protein